MGVGIAPAVIVAVEELEAGVGVEIGGRGGVLLEVVGGYSGERWFGLGGRHGRKGTIVGNFPRMVPDPAVAVDGGIE